MKLIVEKIHGTVYVYTESEAHYKIVRGKNKPEGRKNVKKLKSDYFADDCDTRNMPDNCYAVFDLKK